MKQKAFSVFFKGLSLNQINFFLEGESPTVNRKKILGWIANLLLLLNNEMNDCMFLSCHVRVSE